MGNEQADKLIRKCVDFLNRIVIEKLDVNLLNCLGKSLADLHDCSTIINSMQFWQLCHKIAKAKESCLTKEYLEKYLLLAAENGSYLPTRALTILLKAHEILGQNRKCSNNEVIVLKHNLKKFFRENFC